MDKFEAAFFPLFSTISKFTWSLSFRVSRPDSWTAEICMDRLGKMSLYNPGETD